MLQLHTAIDRDSSVPRALGRASVLLDAVRDGIPRLTVALTRGDSVVLGSRQRAGRVVDLEACARAGVSVLRRVSTGPAACLRGEAIVWTLALPRVDTLLSDATLRTILNRNVRLLLPGLTRWGATAAYFGREWIALRHRPGVLLGYDLTADGRVLIEAFVGWSNDFEIPRELASPEERSVDRWMAKRPVALSSLVGDRCESFRLAEGLLTAAAERAGAVAFLEEPLDAEDVPCVCCPDDPVPAGFRLGSLVRVPIGWVEAAEGTGGRWFGGDALTSNAWLDARGSGSAEGAGEGPLEGARWEDFEASLRGGG